MSSVIYYLKKIYTKNDQLIPIRFFLNKTSDLMFFYTNITMDGEIDDISYNLLNNYIKAKKTKNALNRFSYLYKIKKAKKSVQYDLFFNSLDIIKPNQKMELFLNNTIYYFRLSDIINIWVGCLTKCENMFCSPIKMKNPYTNIVFNKASLHNIYQSLLCSHYQIPKWITLFFECDFDLTKFSYNNYTILKEIAIEDFMINGSIYEKYENISNMMHEYRIFLNYTNIQTPITFAEKQTIVKKLSTYLRNYLYGEYSCHPLKRKRCKNKARRGLKHYLNNNDDIQTYRQLPIGLMTPSINEWSSDSLFSRRISQMVTSSMPPPPPPPTIETSIVTLNTDEIETPQPQLPTIPETTEVRPPVSRIGNHRNGSLFNLNLSRVNRTADPFTPTFTLNRSPNNSTSNTTNSTSNTTNNSFNMRMFNR